MSLKTSRIGFIDSHTEGEPTRVITSGTPDLGLGSARDQLLQLKQQDWFRRSVILEPRGWEALVGAVLCAPQDSRCVTGVIFINNTGYLGMCGHGTIGLAVTLHHLGRIDLGKHLIETPVGVVEVDLLDRNTVAIENVPSYRLHHRVKVNVEGLGPFFGDVAWGGNWFFLVDGSPYRLELSNLARLADTARRLRDALNAQNITGNDGEEIDHIEFFEPSETSGVHSRNYVYCPGGAYDRSPCGTGTSAKIACLAADGKLEPGETWVQESIIGSRFQASYKIGESGTVIPRVVGRAYVCSEGALIREANDPFENGIGV